MGYFDGNEKAILAINMFCYRIAKYIASYIVPLEGIPDALVFTAGIGERSPLKRSLITDLLKPFGFKLNSEFNEKNQIIISDSSSTSPKVFVIPTNEDLVI